MLKMKCHVALLIFILLGLKSMVSAEDYFPQHRFDDHKASWYSKQLMALNEPSIYEQVSNQDKEIYRFTWLRTFHNPISIRVEKFKQTNPIIIVKVADGKGGYDPGKIKISNTVTISNKTYKQFIRKIRYYYYFWHLAETGGSLGFDGAQWIVEGMSNGKYHIVDRWSPGGRVRKIGLLFLKLSELEVKKIY